MELTRLTELIGEERQRRGSARGPQSLRAAAERMGISHVALGDIVRERAQPSPETCMKIAEYLDLPATLVLQLVGHLPPGVTGPEGLSPAQQEAARLIDDLPNEAWRRAALDHLRRLKQLTQEDREGTRLHSAVGDARQW